MNGDFIELADIHWQMAKRGRSVRRRGLVFPIGIILFHFHLLCFVNFDFLISLLTETSGSVGCGNPIYTTNDQVEWENRLAGFFRVILFLCF